MKQSTIQSPVSVKGVGLHTGKKVILTFRPAPANHGYRFQRIDLPEQPVITADVKLVTSTNRGTTLRSGEAQVSTVEHVLSALTGVGIDNVLMEIDGDGPGHRQRPDGNRRTRNADHGRHLHAVRGSAEPGRT